ncbi:MAG: YhgE/Pip family protein [Bacillota bacterium]
MSFFTRLKKVIVHSLLIFRRDFLLLLHTPLALAVIVGIAFIPSLYAWCNIDAYKNPYDYTGNLKIAVANADQPVHDDIFGTIDTGSAIEAALRDNDDFGWVFQDEESAVEGVKSGKYYAAIVIPEDFSASFLHIGQGELRQPKIQYYINEKKNAIAPVLTNIGVTTIQANVNRQFIDTVANAVSDYLESVSGDAETRLNELYASVMQDMADVDTNIAAYREGAANIHAANKGSTAIHELKANLDEIKTAAANGDDALKQGVAAVNSSRDAFSAFQSNLNANVDGMITRLDNAGTTAAADLGAANGKLQTVNNRINAALTDIQTIINLNANVINDLRRISAAAPGSAADSLIAEISAENQRHQQLLNALKQGNSAVAAAANGTVTLEGGISATLNKGKSDLRSAAGDFQQQSNSKLAASMDESAAIVGKLEGLLAGIDDETEQLKAVLDALSGTLTEVDAVAADTEKVLATVEDQVSAASDDLTAVKGYIDYHKVADRLNGDKADLAEFIAAPINVKTSTIYPMADYGAAMAPFFSNLAIWVGGIMMLAVLKLEVAKDDKIRDYRLVEGYFGRWLLFITVGIAQALIIGVGDLLLTKIDCAHPFLFLACCCLASFVYINLIYALAVAFRHVGKALCVILLIFQIPGSSGTYPVELATPLFRALYPTLPFTYSINAMREAIAGTYAHHFASNMLILASFLLIALVIGVVIRPLFVNLNALFDRKLKETDLMITEEEDVVRERIRLMAALRLLSSESAFRQKLERRAERFESDYHHKIHRIFRFVLFGLPLLLVILMFVSGHKMLVLILWIISLIAFVLFLVLAEYFHERHDLQQRLTEYSDAELLAIARGEKDDFHDEEVRS